MWIVTREGSDAEQSAQALRARGLRARCLPCIEREALPWPPALAPRRDAAGTLIMCTSPFAARLVIARWPALREAAGDTPLSCAATAPATARVLDEAGVPVTVRAHGGVVALAGAVASAVRGGPRPLVLYPTSDVGEQSAEHATALAELPGFADVCRAIAYATRAAPELERALGDLEPDAAMLVFSPSAVDALSAAATRAGAALPRTVVCVGDSTARAYERATKRHAVQVPRGAELADFLSSLPETAP